MRISKRNIRVGQEIQSWKEIECLVRCEYNCEVWKRCFRCNKNERYWVKTTKSLILHAKRFCSSVPRKDMINMGVLEEIEA